MVGFGKSLRVSETPIAGMMLVELPVHGDARGWFKENWQREKMVAEGLPDFTPVQNNISFNETRGTTRGLHAEPWDKYVSVATGRIFGAWVDLRRGPGFGTVFTAEVDPSTAVFVPRGVANAFQTLEDATAYVYLVDDHWSPAASYTFLNLADETLAIPWPIPLDDAEISEKDRTHPRLGDVEPMGPRRTLVTGADGQLGRALRAEFGEAPHIEYTSRLELDITGTDLTSARRWRDYDTLINAAAYTKVDDAETLEGREAAWRANVTGVSQLAQVAAEHGLTLVHLSSDYVFDGEADTPYREDDPVSPLGVYAQTKAAGDAIVATAPRHYIVRTGWVIGDGANFVRTMLSLAERGVDPRVVDDQTGRLSFASELARGIRHLLEARAPFGTYNLTGGGEPMSWAAVAREVFRLSGHDPERVSPVTTAQYGAGRTAPTSPRPKRSVLDLSRITATGFQIPDAADTLAEYIERHRTH